MEIDTTYNGWKNRATWNVALWIQNEESLYHFARDCQDYNDFAQGLKECSEGEPISFQTPDGVAWNDSALDVPRLDELLTEL